MRLDVVLPNESVDIDPKAIADLAVQAESLGYGAVWLPEHLLPPTTYGAVYGGVFEPLVLLSRIAAVTRSIVLGTSVLILPLHEPVLLAKQTATLERLAPRRVVLGVGVGWEPAEFAALNVDFTERGARTDEAIDLIRHLHGGGPGGFQGRYFRVPGGVFEPRPTAPVPIMVGGTSGAALRRAARRGDVWQAIGLTPDEFRTRCHALRLQAGDRQVAVGVRLSWSDTSGGVDDLVGYAHEWAAAGAEQLAIHFGDWAHAAERMAAFIGSYRRNGGG